MESGIEARVQFLRSEAKAENRPFSEPSRNAFLAFMREAKPTARPVLFRTNKGTLVAVWGGGGDGLSLDFLDDGGVQISFWVSAEDEIKRWIRRVEPIGGMFRFLKEIGAVALLNETAEAAL